MASNPSDRLFIPDLSALRMRARHQFMKGGLTPSYPESDHKAIVEHMIEADLVAERVPIESYREMVTFIGPRDPTSRRLMESILAQEEEHAEDLVDLLEDLPKD